ncbi:uncharacterized protein PFL1_00369 [Pseudozyma flocculosa PF-1]|uniref:SET domain-containing protein n=1 Tax=Pseudozyma flocculosa TaxID=84751 RepID=A0A5C3ETN6_9BASI|nr:uncharacterized protein PFL1_00369 [Pseudozyma flocculosa PF-1]EPQ32172.1 hypothetical protein PFL1_00369 [Pseudozyma flocculosa PF-1]SPO34886.1 uncharacterized protein PSFLO_00357 [Pseudozyma flocculosa]
MDPRRGPTDDSKDAPPTKRIRLARDRPSRDTPAPRTSPQYILNDADAGDDADEDRDSGDSSSDQDDEVDHGPDEAATDKRHVGAKADDWPFAVWCAERGIWMDPKLTINRRKLRTIDHAYVAAKDPYCTTKHTSKRKPAVIPQSQRVVKVPKRAILSTRTSALARHLAKQLAKHPTIRSFEPSQRSSLDLALCLFYELLLGEDSDFKPYVDTLVGQAPHLPMFRRSDPLRTPWKWIRGTEAHRIERRARIASRRSWKEKHGYSETYGLSSETVLEYLYEVAVPVLSSAPGIAFDPDDFARMLDAISEFQWAVSMVRSRSFIVDLYHGPALVPVCDAFDHSDKPTVEFESIVDVCVRCGSAADTLHPHIGPARAPRRAEPDNIHDSDVADDGDEDDDDDDEDDTVDMWAIDDLGCGDEVFNNYGPLSNAELLTQYGFALPGQTHVERFTWDIRFAKERREVGDALGIRDWDEVFERCIALPRPRSISNDENDADAGDDDRAMGAMSEASKRVASLRNLDFHNARFERQLDETDMERLDKSYAFFRPLAANMVPDVLRGEEAKAARQARPSEVDKLRRQDDVQPLFLHAFAGVSRVLWRLALLVQIPRGTAPTAVAKSMIECEDVFGAIYFRTGQFPRPPASVPSSQVPRLDEDEPRAAAATMGSNVSATATATATDIGRAREMVITALGSLQRLLEQRLAKLYYHHHQPAGEDLLKTRAERHATVRQILNHAAWETKRVRTEMEWVRDLRRLCIDPSLSPESARLNPDH